VGAFEIALESNWEWINSNNTLGYLSIPK